MKSEGTDMASMQDALSVEEGRMDGDRIHLLYITKQTMKSEDTMREYAQESVQRS